MLDRGEVRALVTELLSENPKPTRMRVSDFTNSADEYEEAEFEAIFEALDTNGDQTISRDEMIEFLKKTCRLAY